MKTAHQMRDDNLRVIDQMVDNLRRVKMRELLSKISLKELGELACLECAVQFCDASLQLHQVKFCDKCKALIEAAAKLKDEGRDANRGLE